MRPTNRLAAIMADLDAVKARKAKPTNAPRPPKPRPGTPPVRVSFLLQLGRRIEDMEIHISPEKPNLDPTAGWFPPFKTAVGWISARLVV